MDNSIGEKIRKFRKRAGISQMELELRIEASPGSISRIESGVINPTKETIYKVVDALDLQSYEAASLFNIKPIKISNILKISKELINSNNLDEILQKAVNDVVMELKLLSAFICVIKGDTLFAQTFTRSWYFDLVMKILEKDFKLYHLPLTSDSNNLCLKSIREKKNFLSDKLSDFVVPAANTTVANAIQRVVGWKTGISVPIMFNNQVLGVVCFGKGYIDNFENEIEILEEFANYIGEAIYRVTNNKSE